MLRYCVNLKAIRYESTILNRIVASKSHCVILAIEKGMARSRDQEKRNSEQGIHLDCIPFETFQEEE